MEILWDILWKRRMDIEKEVERGIQPGWDVSFDSVCRCVYQKQRREKYSGTHKKYNPTHSHSSQYGMCVSCQVRVWMKVEGQECVILILRAEVGGWM